MNTILYFSVSGAVYETRAYSQADIDKLVQDQALQCLTTADGQFDFWFSSSARGCQRRGNRLATELLMASSGFTAKSVPILHGCVVVAAHDSEGDLDGLSWKQLERLAQCNRSITARAEKVLRRRLERDDRARRAPAPSIPAPVSCAHPRAAA